MKIKIAPEAKRQQKKEEKKKKEFIDCEGNTNRKID